MVTPTPHEADRLARQVYTYRLHLKPDENVTIEVYPTALPWALGFVREARRMGARPMLHFEDESSYWAAVEEGHADLIGNPGAHEWAALSKTDAYVYFWGPEDNARLGKLSGKIAERLVAFNMRWYAAARRAGLRGVRMGIARVTPHASRRWGVPFETWRKEIVKSSMLDPKTLLPDAKKLQRALEGRHAAHITHPNGTDLTLSLLGRKAVTALGWVTPASMKTLFSRMASVPDGSVYVAVDESTADGTLVSNRMSGLFGEPVRGGRWTFRRGRLVDQRYTAGAKSVGDEYAHGGTGRDRPSMLEVGLDPNIHISPNLEENERGAVSVGIGGNSGFGGTNRSDFLAHLTVAGAELAIDGRTVVRGGRIV